MACSENWTTMDIKSTFDNDHHWLHDGIQQRTPKEVCRTIVLRRWHGTGPVLESRHRDRRRRRGRGHRQDVCPVRGQSRVQRLQLLYQRLFQNVQLVRRGVVRLIQQQLFQLQLQCQRQLRVRPQGAPALPHLRARLLLLLGTDHVAEELVSLAHL